MSIKTIKHILFIFCFLLISSVSAHAKPLISGLSNNKILIDARFSGTKLFLFGARNTAGDIVVVIRGPEKKYVVRKKERIAGIWLNKKQMNFNDVYSFYSVYSTKSIEDLKNNLTYKNLLIGIENVPLEYSGKIYLEEIGDFRDAILKNRFEDNLYDKDIKKINFMGDTLFKTELTFPKKIPHGLYHVEIYLIDDKELVGVQTIPVVVKRAGFEAFVYDAAHEHTVYYALFCILAAIVAGWVASAIFWKV
jgi:uncharacterized protein (TIGR02186 family)